MKKFINNPLYRNSFFILLNTLICAFFGLFFWMLAARFYSSADVGKATALVNAAVIIGSISSFGLGTGMIRFLPTSNEKSLLFNSILTFSLISSLAFGIIFLLGTIFFLPALKFLLTPLFAITFILFLIFQTNNVIVNTGLLALRKADYSFAQNLGLGLRLPLVIPLAFIGVMGIFGSIGFAFAISSLIGMFIIYKQGIFLKPALSKKMIKKISNFSLANYAIDNFVIVQGNILPIMILNMLGAAEAAYFYVAFQIVTLLYAIPSSVFMSLFIEGSHDEPLRKNLIKSLAIVFALMIPVGVAVYFYGNILLSLFNKEYSQNAYEVLKILVLSSVFVTFNTMFLAVKRIQKDMKAMVEVNGLLFVSTLFFSYFFITQYGLFGVGLGWIVAEGLTLAVTGIIVWKEIYHKKITRNSSNNIHK